MWWCRSVCLHPGPKEVVQISVSAPWSGGADQCVCTLVQRRWCRSVCLHPGPKEVVQISVSAPWSGGADQCVCTLVQRWWCRSVCLHPGPKVVVQISVSAPWPKVWPALITATGCLPYLIQSAVACQLVQPLHHQHHPHPHPRYFGRLDTSAAGMPSGLRGLSQCMDGKTTISHACCRVE